MFASYSFFFSNTVILHFLPFSLPKTQLEECLNDKDASVYPWQQFIHVFRKHYI